VPRLLSSKPHVILLMVSLLHHVYSEAARQLGHTATPASPPGPGGPPD